MAKYQRPMDATEEDGMEEEGEEGTLNLSFNDVPEAEQWKDGETYELTVKQVSHDKDSAEFEVISAGTEEEEEAEEAGDEEVE